MEDCPDTDIFLLSFLGNPDVSPVPQAFFVASDFKESLKYQSTICYLALTLCCQAIG